MSRFGLVLHFFLCLCSSSILAEEIKVGVLAALSGTYANYGRNSLNGVQLAVEEANAGGGISGKQVKLIVEDIGTLDSRRAVSAARKLLDVDRVDLLLPLIVEDSEVVLPLTANHPIFSMVVGCGAQQCGFNLGPYNVRAPSSHDAIVERLVSFVARDPSVSRACVVAAESTYFEAYGRYIAKLSKDAGHSVNYVSVPLSNTEDYRDVALRFARDRCDVIYSWLAMGSVGSFFRRVRENGSKAQFVGIVETDDPQILKTAGYAAEGVLFARFDMGTKEFQERFQRRFKMSPARPAVPSYDGVKLLLSLVKKVGTAPEALKTEILKVKDIPAENGVLTYTSQGERIGERVRLMRIEQGAPVEVVE